MFRKVMGWIAGKGDDVSTPPGALPPTARPDGDGPHGEVPQDRAGEGRGEGARGPVFSSRAVRDAAVVTAAIDGIRRFVAGTEQADDLILQVRSLSAEQFGFLQISIDPALTDKAVAQAADGDTPPALRRLLADINDGGRVVDEPAPPAVAAPAAASTAPAAEAALAVASPMPPSGLQPSAPDTPPAADALSVPVGEAGGDAVPPPRSAPLFTNLLSRGPGTLVRDATSAGRAEMRAMPTPTTRVPGAMSLRAAPATPVKPLAMHGPIPAPPSPAPLFPGRCPPCPAARAWRLSLPSPPA